MGGHQAASGLNPEIPGSRSSYIAEVGYARPRLSQAEPVDLCLQDVHRWEHLLHHRAHIVTGTVLA